MTQPITLYEFNNRWIVNTDDDALMRSVVRALQGYEIAYPIPNKHHSGAIKCLTQRGFDVSTQPEITGAAV